MAQFGNVAIGQFGNVGNAVMWQCGQCGTVGQQAVPGVPAVYDFILNLAANEISATSFLRRQ